VRTNRVSSVAESGSLRSSRFHRSVEHGNDATGPVGFRDQLLDRLSLLLDNLALALDRHLECVEALEEFGIGSGCGFGGVNVGMPCGIGSTGRRIGVVARVEEEAVSVVPTGLSRSRSAVADACVDVDCPPSLSFDCRPGSAVVMSSVSPPASGSVLPTRQHRVLPRRSRRDRPVRADRRRGSTPPPKNRPILHDWYRPRRPADRLVEFLERADVVVVEQGPLQSFPEIVCLLVRGFDPLGSPVDGKDDLSGDATVFEGELRHVLEVILLEVSIPDRPPMCLTSRSLVMIRVSSLNR